MFNRSCIFHIFHLQTVPDLLDVITDSLDISVSKLREMVKDRAPWQAAVHEIAESDMT